MAPAQPARDAAVEGVEVLQRVEARADVRVGAQPLARFLLSRGRRQPAVGRIHDQRRPVGVLPPLEPEFVVADPALGRSQAGVGLRIRVVLREQARRPLVEADRHFLRRQLLFAGQLGRPLQRHDGVVVPDALQVRVAPGGPEAVARRLGARGRRKQGEEDERDQHERRRGSSTVHLAPPRERPTALGRVTPRRCAPRSGCSSCRSCPRGRRTRRGRRRSAPTGSRR